MRCFLLKKMSLDQFLPLTCGPPPHSCNMQAVCTPYLHGQTSSSTTFMYFTILGTKLTTQNKLRHPWCIYLYDKLLSIPLAPFFFTFRVNCNYALEIKTFILSLQLVGATLENTAKSRMEKLVYSMLQNVHTVGSVLFVS